MLSSIRAVATRSLAGPGPAAAASVRCFGSAAAGRSHTALRMARKPLHAVIFRRMALPARGFAAATKPAAKKPAAKKPAAAKPAAKKPAAKKTVAAAAKPTKKAAAKKPAKKTAKKAAAKKPVKKTVKKARAKKALTPEEKQKLLVRTLKKTALLKEEPARLPQHPWILYVSEKTKGVSQPAGDKGRSNIGAGMSDLGAAFKALSPSELQRLRDAGVANREANIANLQTWAASHSAATVADANRARARLAKITGKTIRRIADSRQPKRPQTAYLLYSRVRWDSGAFAGLPLAEAARAISAEWKALPEADRKTYERDAQADFNRYASEVQSVLGRSVSKSASPAP